MHFLYVHAEAGYVGKYRNGLTHLGQPSIEPVFEAYLALMLADCDEGFVGTVFSTARIVGLQDRCGQELGWTQGPDQKSEPSCCCGEYKCGASY